MVGEMDQVEVVTSSVSNRDRTEIERTVRFTGELLATYVLGLRTETLYRLEAGDFLIHTYDKSPVGPSRRSLSHDVGRGRGYTAKEVADLHPKFATVLNIPSPHDEILGTLRVHQRWSDTQPPWGSVTINDGNATTSTSKVTLTLRASDDFGSGVAQMRIMNGGGHPWEKWRPYVTTTSWELSEGEGRKTVYVQFKDRADNVSKSAKDTITFRRKAR